MTNPPILAVEKLTKYFPVTAGGFFTERTQVHAVDGVSFTLQAGEVLAVVGESGCGKSTLALTLLGIEEATGGSIDFSGRSVIGQSRADQKAMRRRIQMIFQDPYESLNPMMTIGDIVAEPLIVHNIAPNRVERAAKVKQALEDAGLKPANEYIDRLPHELSGGQRQRVVIAGALVLEPQVLLADEPVSMLDVSIRAEILNLLNELRTTRGIAILLITHDLNTVASIADRIAVMYLGRIVEIGPTAAVLRNPQHPYMKALLSVAPVPNPRLRRERIILQGETPDPLHLPSGCRFHPRCPVAVAQCREVDPVLRLVDISQEQEQITHQAACILIKQ